MSVKVDPMPSSRAVASGECSDPFSLRGRRALITGAGQGIGFALARGLGVAGAELGLNDVDPVRLEQAVATLRGVVCLRMISRWPSLTRRDRSQGQATLHLSVIFVPTHV